MTLHAINLYCPQVNTPVGHWRSLFIRQRDLPRSWIWVVGPHPDLSNMLSDVYAIINNQPWHSDAL